MTFYHCYRPHRFTPPAMEVIGQANDILTELSEQGYVLTLRQLFYQFVSKVLIENSEREYKRLGRIMTDAREAGLVSWTAIEDRGRNCYGPQPEEDVNGVLEGLEQGIQFDMWRRQPKYIEVWVEKQALEGVISRPCSRMDVGYMACKGYLSASEAWRAGLRFADAIREGHECTLIHLADHDPSGIDMTRDNNARLALFAQSHGIEIRRIALNYEQVEEYDPPPNPTKVKDSRAAGYMDLYGSDSWELDALPPSVLDGLIRDTIEEYRDPDLWAEILEEQEEARRPLAALAANWEAVEDFMTREGLI